MTTTTGSAATGARDVDVLILGGGIAGLWLLDRARAEGYAAMLLEKDALGGGQTMASQGIIHSGLKYRLPGGDDLTLDELADMPARWLASLQGTAGPDLRAARLLSEAFHVWIPPRRGAGLLAGLAQWQLRSRTAAVPSADWPAVFCGSRSGGALFRVDEPVVDVPTVVAALARQHTDAIRRLPGGDIGFAGGVFAAGAVRLRVGALVLTAGAGNDGLCETLQPGPPAGQRRPLHQVLIAGMRQPVYAHCAGASVKPMATVTSHPLPDGDWLWYVGGGLAEDGVGQAPAELVAAAQRQLPDQFPGADFAAARWSTLRVDRAEGGDDDGGRPGDVSVQARDGVLVAWPTKLALAPRLADVLLGRLRQDLGPPKGTVLSMPDRLAVPRLAQPPWLTVEQWT